MNTILTRHEQAELMGIHVRTVDFLTVHEGLPTVEGGAPVAGSGPAGRAPRRFWHATRRELAKMFGVHADTITHRLPDGLGAALIEPGGRGRDAIFDLRLAYRWHLADIGELNTLVKRDFQVLSAAGVLALHHLSPMALLGPATHDADSAAAPRSKGGKR